MCLSSSLPYACLHYPSLHVSKIHPFHTSVQIFLLYMCHPFPTSVQIILLYVCPNIIPPYICPNYPSLHVLYMGPNILPSLHEFKLFFPTCVCVSNFSFSSCVQTISPSLWTVHESKVSPSLLESKPSLHFSISGELCRLFIYFFEMMESDFESWRSKQGLYQCSRSSPCIEVYTVQYVLYSTWREKAQYKYSILVRKQIYSYILYTIKYHSEEVNADCSSDELYMYTTIVRRYMHILVRKCTMYREPVQCTGSLVKSYTRTYVHHPSKEVQYMHSIAQHCSDEILP
jgi:hypothetical protein